MKWKSGIKKERTLKQRIISIAAKCIVIIGVFIVICVGAVIWEESDGNPFGLFYNYEKETAFGLDLEMVKLGSPSYRYYKWDYTCYMGKYEITQAQWIKVMGDNPSHFTGDPNLPVENVSWNDAKEFCRRLSDETGKAYDLPTAAEWAYAAENPFIDLMYSGGNDIDEVAWYDGNSNNKTHGVGSKRPNAKGMYDMSGNVWEWCLDLWQNLFEYKGDVDVKEYQTARAGCGGSAFSGKEDCTTRIRFRAVPEERYNDVGFRVVCRHKHNKKYELEESGHPKQKDSDKKEKADDIKIDMVFVQGGTFTMGATAEQGDDVYEDEVPAHSVTLSSYYIGKYEITQEQWKAVMGTTIEQQCNKAAEEVALLYNIGVGDNYPMYYVSWTEAKEFCEKLSTKTGKKYALPTEAQWEFAARGGVKSKDYKYSGSDNIDEVAWYKENSSSRTHAVGGKAPNELGIYDMSGNVWEWCTDWYSNSYYRNSAVTNPTGPTSESDRVFRGGSWGGVAPVCRVSHRGYFPPIHRIYYVGFRVVCIP